MTFDWNVYQYDYHNRLRNLDNKAQGVVKSDKFFPVFKENNQEKIFKPLSKTKPLSTPYFAYSEVFWSTIINKYFDSNTPIYRLAICKNIEEDFKNKYNYGTIVDSLIKPGEKLINLYEIFENYPDPAVNIKGYINFCERYYDYTKIFDSKLIRENSNLATSLAIQILISILKLDQNYHYENPLFKEKDNKIESMAPMIDHEFSSMFLYLDDFIINKYKFEDAISLLTITPKKTTDIFETLRYEAFATLSKNLDLIVSRYKETSIEFLEKLKKFISDLKEEPILLENHSYITPFNSEDWKVGYTLFKNNNPEGAKMLQQTIKTRNPDINLVSDIVYNEVLVTSITLEKEIEKRLIKS